jgi:hypothetical protein
VDGVEELANVLQNPATQLKVTNWLLLAIIITNKRWDWE